MMAGMYYSIVWFTCWYVLLTPLSWACKAIPGIVKPVFVVCTWIDWTLFDLGFRSARSFSPTPFLQNTHIISAKWISTEQRYRSNRSIYLCILRFLADMPYGWVFITFAVLLRMTEGVGSSMSLTAIYTLLPELYPTRVGLVTVRTRCMLAQHIVTHNIWLITDSWSYIMETSCSKQRWIAYVLSLKKYPYGLGI